MRLVEKKYVVPFLLIITLFFMWGFARAVLDVLNKHFQDTLHITLSQSTLVQATTYLGYFLMAIPAGMVINRFGYRRGVVGGLLLFAAGAFLFIPGASLVSFPIFLIALFLIGCGLVVLETSANPYAAELGDKSTAASRLNFAQSFNGLGCILAPVLVGGFLFGNADASVALPYTAMGVVVLVVALIFSKVNLPELTTPVENRIENTEGACKGAFSEIGTLLRTNQFLLGLIALLFYEISEISINSLFINYVTSDGWMDKATASVLLSFGALGLFMLARILGSWIMTKVKAITVLMICGMMTVIGAVAVMMNIGVVSKAGLFICYAFEAIMFPTIFAITIGYAKGMVKTASSLLMMTPIGGAIGTMLMGAISDNLSISMAFVVPALGYACVFFYSVIIKNAHNKDV